MDTMDALAPLATQIAAILAPFLPQLVKVGQAVAGGLSDQAEAHKGALAQAIWGRLFPKVNTTPAAHEAVHDAAQNPGDDDYQASLRVQLRKLLAHDPALARELQDILEQDASKDTVNVSAGGDRSVAVGGSVQGSSIVTGDGNRLTG
jgi:hypothetical protein